MTRSVTLLAAALALALVAPVQAAEVRTANVTSELVSARAAIAPGETFTLVLRQSVRPHWHTYWINPGDSGEPTRTTWTLPRGYEAGPLLHPAPRIDRLGPIVTYVHDGEVLYPVAIRAPADARPGAAAHIALKATWLVCDEICVPEQGAFDLTLPVRAQGADDPRGAALAARAIDALPTALTSAGFDLTATAQRIAIAFPMAPAPDDPLSRAVNAGVLRNAAFFPYDAALIDHAAPQKVTLGGGRVRFEIAPSLSFQPGAAQGAGLVTAEIRDGDGWRPRAFMFGRPPGEGPLPTLVAARWSGEAPPATPAAQPLPQAAVGGLLGALAFAFLGGLILNLMPCVFPVLSIKALSLAGGAQAGTARRHGAIFFAGVMATFLALALTLAALKAAGMAVGWGFQLQEPAVIAALAALFLVIGLNLIGAFEIGGSLQNAGAGSPAARATRAHSSLAPSRWWPPRPAPPRSWPARLAGRRRNRRLHRSACSPHSAPGLQRRSQLSRLYRACRSACRRPGRGWRD